MKSKQEDYLKAHRAVTGLSERTVWELMMKGQPLESLLLTLPDELHPWTQKVYSRLKLKIVDIIFDVAWAFEDITQGSTEMSRKDFAEKARTYEGLTPYLFMMFDGRDLHIPILKTLKPEGGTRPIHISEDVA